MSNDTTKSKFLSLVLRHDPGSIGLSLDAQGWASVDELLAKAPATLGLGHDDLLRITAQSDKQRFALSPDGARVRANQGHSVPVDLALAPQVPPDRLYHGTATRFLDAILREGLVKGARHHVHLSASIETASSVGRRYGELALLAIDSGAMHARGHVFFLSENGVWLVDAVPPGFLAVTEAGASPTSHARSAPWNG